MSFCSEVKRTLVKSPPELWSELSDPEALARHLDGMGEIRITRTEPETALDWEADGVSGSVRLEHSGFGTRVTLSLIRELVEPEPTADAEPVAATDPEPAYELKPEPPPEPEATSDPPTAEEPEPEAPIEREHRVGFFARLFRRRKQTVAPVEPIAVVQEPEPIAAKLEPAIEPEQTAAEPMPVESIAAPESGPEPAVESEPQVEVATELADLEMQMAAQDSQTLAAMLDRLGAAHHRPFSRS